MKRTLEVEFKDPRQSGFDNERGDTYTSKSEELMDFLHPSTLPDEGEKKEDVDASIGESLQEFINDVEYMRGLYHNHKYTLAEQTKDRLSEKLDDIMKGIN